VSKLCKAQGSTIINEITRGNSIVQQNDINWSKRILGKKLLLTLMQVLYVGSKNINIGFKQR